MRALGVGKRAGVLDQRLAQLLGVQRGGRVVHREQRPLALHHQRPVDLADLRAGGEVGQRVAAERHDDPRGDDRQLLLEHGHPVRDLGLRGIAVLRGPRLDDVRDVDVAALETCLTQEFVQELPGAAHERAALLVLALARSLANEHHRGGLGAVAGHEVRGRLADLETAPIVRAYVFLEGSEPEHRERAYPVRRCRIRRVRG